MKSITYEGVGFVICWDGGNSGIWETPPGWVLQKNWVGGILWKNSEDRMTPAQKEILLVVAEWWKMYGYGPSIDDVMRMTGEKSRGNVNRKMWKLVELGLCKGFKGRPRSIRPSDLRVRDIQ